MFAARLLADLMHGNVPVLVYYARRPHCCGMRRVRVLLKTELLRRRGELAGEESTAGKARRAVMIRLTLPPPPDTCRRRTTAAADMFYQMDDFIVDRSPR